MARFDFSSNYTEIADLIYDFFQYPTMPLVLGHPVCCVVPQPVEQNP